MAWGGVGYRCVKVDLIPSGVEGRGGWRGMRDWRYVKVDLIPRDVEEGGGVEWGGVQVCEGRFDS